MSYFLRIWMSNTVATAMEEPTTKSCRRLFSGRDCSETRATRLSDVTGRRVQPDESLRIVMYFSCWGQG
ncbi:hypothetical protein LR48_Vigan08g112500 [Vigna angularis]|uniref:Uncharacterized protein n=1 Tax=Phaseolus angularis TaxID=3914 RepID=A0A0L9V5N5_PHAAN|nr:hypothetical protein LR48_Vigan08g112500 [Vigna angularis]